MAAPNEYYDSTERYHPHHNNYQEHGYNEHSNSYPTSNPRYSYAAPPPLGPPPNHYGHNNSSFADESENEPYLASGRNDNGDEYAENIPLKANADMPPPKGGWMHQQHRQDPMGGYPPQHPPPHGGEGLTGRKRERRKGRFFDGKIPWVTYLLTSVQIIVFIVELVKNAQLTGTPIEMHPTFNPMIGPSPYVQINMGARFVPCMKNIDGVQNANQTITWPCPNTTTTDPSAASNHCTLSDLCGFGGVPNPVLNGSLDNPNHPNQWFRFIIPMFLHGGFVHIGFNLLIQLTMGADMERMVGWWRYATVYLASGVFGFVLGGNYAAQGISSTGCSGALFGVFALYVLDLLYTWKSRRSPWTELIIIILGVGISFFLGLLPGLDNFSHIGGFIMGLALGLCVMRSPNALRERIGLARDRDNNDSFVTMSGAVGEIPNPRRGHDGDDNEDNRAGNNPFTNYGNNNGSRTLNFFQGRKPLWWAWWLVRVGALVAVLIGFILLIVDFYKYPKTTCSWCYRLSCLPIKNWCSEGNLQLTPT